jgi:quinol monooxygenase YgiN
VERLLLWDEDMVRLTVSLDAASQRSAQDLLDAFRFLIPSTKLEPGCIGCTAWKERGSTVNYTEEWTTEPAMRERVRSHAFTLLLAVIESVQQPRVQFDFVTSTLGIDYLAEVRGSNAGL